MPWIEVYMSNKVTNKSLSFPYKSIYFFINILDVG
jgi:hypothetical protein